MLYIYQEYYRLFKLSFKSIPISLTSSHFRENWACFLPLRRSSYICFILPKASWTSSVSICLGHKHSAEKPCLVFLARRATGCLSKSSNLWSWDKIHIHKNNNQSEYKYAWMLIKKQKISWSKKQKHPIIDQVFWHLPAYQYYF